MPNISAHLIVGREVGKRLNINSDDFMRGNVLPDVIDMKDSHHKIKKGIYFIPNIEYSLNNLDFDKDIDLGYFVHLLLDRHYLYEYLTDLYPNENIFIDKKIYSDYDYLNKRIVDKFNLDIDYCEKILNELDGNILKEKLKYNIECFKQDKEGETTYLDFDSFAKFIEEIVDVIVKELKEYSKSNKKLNNKINNRYT